VYRIESYRLLLYRPILRASLQVHQLLTDRITHDDQRAFNQPVTRKRARVRAVLWSMIRERVGREGAEAHCNLISAYPWYKDRAVLVLATITPHSLHQEEVITAVSCQSL